MERAIFIIKLGQLKYVNDRYGRLYYGNEFCQRLIPAPAQLKRLLSYLGKRKMSLSLVTPYVTESGLSKLQPLFELLKKRKLNCEIIVNDWGVLNLINRSYPDLTPVLGRLLSKQKRGPRVVKLLKREKKAFFVKSPQNPRIRGLLIQKSFPLELDPYYKGANSASVPIIHKFLASRRIKRIELDNTAQGLSLDLPKNEIHASVYLPYVYISTTFFCPTAGCEQRRKSLLKIKPCKRECQRYIFRLRHKTMPKAIFLKGNTQFYKNQKLSVRELKKTGVDRIVYQPEIPI